MKGCSKARRGAGEEDEEDAKTRSSSCRYISDKWVERDMGILGFV